MSTAAASAWLAASSCAWASQSELRMAPPLAAAASDDDDSATFASSWPTVGLALFAVDGAVCPAAECASPASECASPTRAMALQPAPLAIDPAPSPAVVGPSTIGSCDDLPLSATLGAPPLTLTWHVVVDGPGSVPPSLTARLASWSLVGRPPPLSHLLESAAFPSGVNVNGVAGRYAFTVVATDHRGVSGTSAPLVVERLAVPAPAVQILGPTTPRASTTTRLRALVAPPCPAAATGQRRALRYAWFVYPGAGGGEGGEGAGRRLSGGISTKLAPFTLPAGSPSVVWLRVTVDGGDGGAPLTSNASITLTPPLEPLQAIIGGGSSRSHGIGDALVLDGSASADPSVDPSDPNATPLRYVWACTGFTRSGGGAAANECARLTALMAPTAGRPKLRLPAGALRYAPATYTFHLTVFASSSESSSFGGTPRRARAAVRVVTSVASPPRVSIALRLPVGSTAPAEGALLRIGSQVAPAANASEARPAAAAASLPGTRWAYAWSLTRTADGTRLSLPPEAARVRNLILPTGTASGLPAGEYTAQLEVNAVAGGGGRQQAQVATVGFAQLRFTINAPPAGGALAVSPRDGAAGGTAFTMAASGFTDAPTDLPLTYEFWYERDGRRVGLAAASEQAVLRGAILPHGVLRIGCTATDVHGASADGAQTVVVAVRRSASSVEALASAASAALSGDGDPTLAAQYLGASIGELPSRGGGGGGGGDDDGGGDGGGDPGIAADQAAVSSLAGTLDAAWQLADGEPTLHATTAALTGAVADAVDAAGAEGERASLRILSLCNDLLDTELVGTMPPARRGSTCTSRASRSAAPLWSRSSPRGPRSRCERWR